MRSFVAVWRLLRFALHALQGLLLIKLRFGSLRLAERQAHIQLWSAKLLQILGVQLATHSWMSNPRMTAEELIDYLTMLCWSALCGIVEAGGSLQRFNSAPHPSPSLPR